MARFEILFPFGTRDLDAQQEITEELLAGLPDYYAKTDTSNNFELLQPVADRFSIEETDIEHVGEATNLDEAASLSELEKHGELVDVYPKPNETLEAYRARVKAEYVLITGEGTPADVINNAARILQISKKSISYSDAPNGAGGEIVLDVPSRAFNETPIDTADLADLLSRTAPASYTVSVLSEGTFTYITPSTYNDSNFNANKGYDGLDANGDPKDNGGTYAGVLQ